MEVCTVPNLRSVKFNTEGWNSAIEGESHRQWENEIGDVLSLNYHAMPPDLLSPLSDIARIREQYRPLVAESGGALVEVEAGQLQDLPALRTVFKFPQVPYGMYYVGAWTIPRRSFSFTAKISCFEIGTTGVRDAVLLDMLLTDGTLKLDPAGRPAGWFQDPYDANVKADVLRNRSDDEEWDGMFPEHPLSRARACLENIRATISFDQSVRGSAPFEGQLPVSGSSRKGWWRRLTGR